MNKNIFNIYKPKGPTSFDIVAQVRKITGVKKVGHAGTLDPLASGVLVIAVGREATKKISEIVGQEKEYIADIKLGVTSTTDDAEGIKTLKYENIKTKKPNLNNIKKIIKKFVGKIDQVPPQFSAIKVNGRRAYKSARKGEQVELKPRQVEIKEIGILKYKYPNLKIRVLTGKGVYIRSLARDIGQELGIGAHLTDLERIRVGDFKKQDAISLDELNSIIF